VRDVTADNLNDVYLSMAEELGITLDWITPMDIPDSDDAHRDHIVRTSVTAQVGILKRLHGWK